MELGGTGPREAVSISAGRGIELRPMVFAHAEELYALIDKNRARLREWLPWVVNSFGPNDLVAFIRDRERDNAARDSYTAVLFFEGAMCGSIGLHTIDRRDRNSSIGYWLDAEFEGRGIMTQACRAIVTEGFRGYGLHRIEIRCARGNAKSNSIPRRLGFAEEGILRDAEWLHDHWVDLRVFSMLEQDWPGC